MKYPLLFGDYLAAPTLVQGEVVMSYQLAKFIDASLSVFQKLTWVRDWPDNWSTKYSVGVKDNIITGPTEGLGFATNVLGDDDGIPMVAYLNQIELQPSFAERVRQIPFAEWKSLSNEEVIDLAHAVLGGSQ